MHYGFEGGHPDPVYALLPCRVSPANLTVEVQARLNVNERLVPHHEAHMEECT